MNHITKGLSVILMVFVLMVLFACDKDSPVESKSHDFYAPMQLDDYDDWCVSTPAEQGLDPDWVLRTYQEAERLSNIYSLLIVKNGYLVAERYFNSQYLTKANPTASVTKSYVSVLTGIALRENVLTSLDQKMIEFFPEIDWQNLSPRKSQITIRQILQMRSGYPWEEFSGDLELLFSRYNWIPLLEEIPLDSSPGTRFGYSNLTAHIMAIILARAAGTSLLTFAQTHLFDHLGVQPEYWPSDSLGYNYGSGDIYFTPREMAVFGQMALNNGQYDGSQIIPEEWIAQSLQPYSFDVYNGRILSYFAELDYGCLWWSSRVGNTPIRFAWGHGGQLIILVHDINMVVVTTADHLPGEFGDTAWQKTKVIMELAGRFIASVEEN